MEMNNEQQNEMDYSVDSRSATSSKSTKSDDTSSPCYRRRQVENKIRNVSELRENFKSRLAYHDSKNMDHEHPGSLYVIKTLDKELR
ncbi:hypothetical protein NPIL_229581, partial [Nephila pilipes]